MSMGVFPSLFSAKEYRKVETKTSKRTIAIKAQPRTNQNANTCAENAWENKTSKFVMSTRKKAGMLPLAGKDGAIATVTSGAFQRLSKTDKKELVESNYLVAPAKDGTQTADVIGYS